MTRFERRDIDRNMERFYLVDVRPALFGWSVVRKWGRIGQGGRVRIDLYETAEAAEAAGARKSVEKQRRGYTPIGVQG